MSAQPTEPDGDALELAEALEELKDWEHRRAAGEVRFMTLDEVRRTLGLVE